MTEPVASDALTFDRADVAPSQLSCVNCSGAIASSYYTWNSAHVCPSCHARLSTERRKPGSFLLATLFGSLAAAAGALVYYGISALTGYEFGLIAIVVGVVVGKAVRAGAGTEAKKRYRALAILLTYLSITATYVPLVLEGMEEGSMVVAIITSVILPFLMLMSFENIIGLVILGIGVYEAWKLSAAPALFVEGPFELAAPPAPPAAQPAPAATL